MPTNRPGGLPKTKFYRAADNNPDHDMLRMTLTMEEWREIQRYCSNNEFSPPLFEKLTDEIDKYVRNPRAETEE
jgi:hypothetical protein